MEVYPDHIMLLMCIATKKIYPFLIREKIKKLQKDSYRDRKCNQKQLRSYLYGK